MHPILDAFKPFRLAVVALLCILGFVLALAVQDPPDASAYAGWVTIECNDDQTTEGDTFRLHIVTGEPSNLRGETIKVYWTTVADTADENDYEPLNREGQASNRYQSRQARMGRTFHTKEDSFSEATEHFEVRAVNAASGGSGGGSCRIAINDDDGPGAIRTWIDSRPTGGTYERDDTIRIRQQFTENVVVEGGSVDVGLLIGQGSDVSHRSAGYISGSGTDTLTFEYHVAGDDFDTDGIEVPGSDYGGDGSIRTSDDREQVNSEYIGVPVDVNHLVQGWNHVDQVSLVSAPAEGYTYASGEHIEVQMRFSLPVQVDGDVLLSLFLGGGDWRGAPYHRGSGTDTLVFRYQVQDRDRDPDGVTVGDGGFYADGTRYGLVGDGSITDAADSSDISPIYDGLRNQIGHQVDGRPVITATAVTSTPPNGDYYRIQDRILISVTFSRPVSVQPTPALRILLDNRTVLARYEDGSTTDTLTFSYEVVQGDVAANGIWIPAQDGFSGSGSVLQADGETSVNELIPALAPQSSQVVRGLPPSAVASRIVSTPARPPFYRLGETIEIAVEFREPVTVQGSPYVSIELDESGPTQRAATYTSGSDTNTLIFSYTVQKEDLDYTGVSLASGDNDGFATDGKVYQVGVMNPVNPHVPGFDDDPNHLVSGHPHVRSVDVVSTPGEDGIYEMGDVIELSVTFDDEVTVTGAPTLSLDVGGDARTAAFSRVTQPVSSPAPINTGQVLIFSYTVQTGEESSDGISVVENGLSLNGATIVGPAAIEPDFSIKRTTFPGHPVEEVAPLLRSARSSADGSRVILTFSEDIQVRPDLRTLSAFAGVDVGVYLRAVIDIFVDGHRDHTSAAAISGKDLTLTLDTAITQGREVEVAYDDVFARNVPGVIVDHALNPLDHFSNQPVANDSTLPDATATNWPVISDYSLTISEGETGTYTVALGAQPTQDVTVTHSISPSTHLTASASTLTFSADNWYTPQTVTLTASADAANSWQEIVHTSDLDGFIVGHLKVLIEE